MNEFINSELLEEQRQRKFGKNLPSIEVFEYAIQKSQEAHAEAWRQLPFITRLVRKTSVLICAVCYLLVPPAIWFSWINPITVDTRDTVCSSVIENFTTGVMSRARETHSITYDGCVDNPNITPEFVQKAAALFDAQFALAVLVLTVVFTVVCITGKPSTVTEETELCDKAVELAFNKLDLSDPAVLEYAHVRCPFLLDARRNTIEKGTQ